jgi:ABC-type uncharacterized transport system substrate-binding protein
MSTFGAVLLHRALVAPPDDEGETVLLRAADGGPRRLPGIAAELIDHGVGVLIVVGAEAVRIVGKAVATTPIVAIDLETDPVRAGFAASFARPGGNVTGLFLDLPVITGKWIELLREVIPDLKRIGLSWDPTTGRDQLNAAQTIAHSAGIEVVVLDAAAFPNFEQAFENLGSDGRTGIIQLTSPGFPSWRKTSQLLH